MEATNNIDFGNVIPNALNVGGRFTEFLSNRSAGSEAARAGRLEQRARNIEADVLIENAKTQIGLGQIERRDITRETDYLISNAIAAAAKQGTVVTDGSTLNMIARIKEEGAYRGKVAMYNAEENARALRISAISTRYAGQVAAVAGKQRQAAYNTTANAALIDAGKSLYDRYGRDYEDTSEDTTPETRWA